MTKEVSPPVRVQKRKKLLFLKFQTVNHEEVWALPSMLIYLLLEVISIQ